MPLLESLALAGAALAAGMVNAIAGGGTLITFPALLAFGTPAIIANATSTLALVIGTIASVYGYREPIRTVRPWLKALAPASLLGGLLGAVLLTRTDERRFAQMVPFLLLFATGVFLLQGRLRRLGRGNDRGADAAPHRPPWLAIPFQFLVAIYGGYFGAGIGILMLASLWSASVVSIHAMNGLKSVLGLLINLVAALYFITAALIDWRRAAVMSLGALCGSFLGAHYAQRISPQRVRQLITAIGLTISAAQFWKQFGR
ncbi:MAG: sulfite exporter TauE/SafE family protein [Planctomycetota bacterium]